MHGKGPKNVLEIQNLQIDIIQNHLWNSDRIVLRIRVSAQAISPRIYYLEKKFIEYKESNW